MPFGAERDGVFDLLRRVGVRAHVESAQPVHPPHQLRVLLIGRALLAIERAIDQHLHDLRGRGRDFAGKHFAGGSVDRNVIALLQGRAVGASACAFCNRSAIPAAPQTQTLPICRATSAACDETPPRDVRMPSAAIMPRKIFRRSFNPGEHHFLAFLRAPRPLLPR